MVGCFPHTQSNYQQNHKTYLAYSPVPFCQSQGDDLAPTKSTIASDVAIVVVIVAIDVIIAIDVVANSGQRWSASNLIITFNSLSISGHLSQLASFKCLLCVIRDQQSSQSGIHPLDPFGITFTFTQSLLTCWSN